MAYNSASELEKLISNCEFENHQYVKLIEHEDELIDSLQKEIDCKEEETKRLQDAVSQLDIDTKQYYKQYTINRDNVDSLKKTNHVLTEHVAAVASKMEIMDAKIQAEGQEQIQHLERYKDIWDSYYKLYESLPLAGELKKQKMMTEDLSKQNQKKELFIHSAKQKIQQLHGIRELCNLGINEFVTALAKIRVGTMQMMQEVEARKTELTQLQDTLRRNLDAESDRNNEKNVQKLTDMHLADRNNNAGEVGTTGSCGQQEQNDIESPMISMLCERDDETEVMQTDVVSPDQINVHFVEEQVATQGSETGVKQIQIREATDRSCEQSLLASTEAYRTCQVATGDSNCLPDRNGSIIDDKNAQADVSTQGHGQPETDGGKIQAGVSTNVQFPSNSDCYIKTQHNWLREQPAQLPYVTYKAKGQESVHIHIDKPVNSDQQDCKQQEQGTDTHIQSQPIKQSHIAIQRQNSLLQHQRTLLRQQIPQVRSVSSLRPPYLETRPAITQVRPPSLHLQINRTSCNSANGSSLRKDVLPHITKPHQTVQRPNVILSRQPGGPSRLPVLQTLRSPIVYSQQQSLVLIPNRMHGVPNGSQTSHLTAASSPLQLTSPPVNHISPPEAQQSPLQLPAQCQQKLQQKTKSFMFSPIYSAERLGTQFRPGHPNYVTQRRASPPMTGQRYPQKKLSPIEKHVQDVEKSSSSQTKAVAPVVTESKPDVSIHGGTKVGTKITVPVVHSSPLVGMEISQPDENRNLQTDFTLSQSDGTDMCNDYEKIKDTSDDQASTIPQTSPDKQVKTPEKNKVRSLSDESFSPFNNEKHLQILADMKKSPGQPDNLYSVPVKRVFAEMEGSTGQEQNSESIQLTVFGQDISSNTAVIPFDGSGDPTNTDHAGQTKEPMSEKSCSLLNRETESGFQFFDSFAKQIGTGDDTSKSAGNVFCFGDGDLNSKNEKQGSPGFSLFSLGSSNDDEISSGFSFDFGNSATKQGEQSTTTNGGSFLSLFGEGGNEEQNVSSSGFSFSFGSNETKSPSFSFF